MKKQDKPHLDTEADIGREVRAILDEKGGQVEPEGRRAKRKRKKAMKETEVPVRKKSRLYLVISYAFVLIFLSLIGWVVYFNLELKDGILASPYNKRQDSQAEYVIRGPIKSADGQILAETEVDSVGNETRVYPFGRLFAHAVGYTVQGKSGIESFENYALLTAHNNIVDHIANDLLSRKNPGDTVVTTLNAHLQQVAYDALGSHNGAVIALDPATGDILTWVSKPDFDPNTLGTDWAEIIGDSANSQLVNRVSQGRYPPGSVFKIITALAYYKVHGTFDDFSYECTGECTIDDQTVHCFEGNVHGVQNFEQAFANSCNCAFTQIGYDLGADALKSAAESVLFNKDISCELHSNASSFALTYESELMELMQTSFGQGKTLVTPYHMALLASAIANDGVIMQPTLIDRIESAEGEVVSEKGPVSYTRILTADEAASLKRLMVGVVTGGSASALSGRGYNAAGKTGSAEYVKSDGSIGTHSWFVGILEPSHPELVIAVLAEDGGSGATTAVPIAGAVFDAFFSSPAYQPPTEAESEVVPEGEPAPAG